MSCPEAAVRRSRRLHLALLALIVAWGAFARSGALAGPFGFGWQHLGASYSVMARNYLRYGPLETRFAMVRNPEPAPPERRVCYFHHPPGLALTTAALAKTIGEGPLAIRLSGVLFGLAQVVITYVLVASALSPAAGLAAAFATAVLPAGAYFSTHGSELGPQAIALALLALWLDERARARDPTRPRSLAVLLAVAASLFFAWPALIVAAFIAARDLFGRRPRRSLLFAAVVPVALALPFLHARIATGSFNGGAEMKSLEDALLVRSAVGAAALMGEATAGQVGRRLLSHVRFLFGVPGLALAVAGLVLALGIRLGFGVGRTDRRFGPRAWSTLAGLATFAALYSLPLLQAVLVHRYWLIVALPLVAFLIGVVVHATAKSRLTCTLWIVVAVVFGIATTVQVREQQLADRTPFYEELGHVLRERVPLGQPLATTERESGCLDFYSERRITYGLADRDLDRFTGIAAPGATPVLPTSGWCAIVEPAVDPARPDADRLVAFLRDHWEETRIRLEKTGADACLFDLSKTKSTGR